MHFGLPTWDMYDCCRRLQTILHIITSSCTRTVLSLAVSLRPVILHYLMNWGYVYASKGCPVDDLNQELWITLESLCMLQEFGFNFSLFTLQTTHKAVLYEGSAIKFRLCRHQVQSVYFTHHCDCTLLQNLGSAPPLRSAKTTLNLGLCTCVPWLWRNQTSPQFRTVEKQVPTWAASKLGIVWLHARAAAKFDLILYRNYFGYVSTQCLITSLPWSVPMDTF